MTNIPLNPLQTKWRKEAALALHNSGYPVEAEAFWFCGDPEKFQAYAVCAVDPNHHAIPIVDHCHFRFCSACEKRAQAKRMEKFMPILEQCGNFPAPSFGLKHVIITTPVSLLAKTVRDDFKKMWAAVPVMFERLFYEVFKDRATKAEKRRQRISMRRLGIGIIAASDFGEAGLKLHFHCLVYSPFIPVEKIQKHWKIATDKTCDVVFIRAVNNWESAAKEVILKYATKLSELPPNLVPVIHEVHFGTRRIRTYGIFYNIETENMPYHSCPVCESGLRYMKRYDYEIMFGKEVPSLVHNTELSRGRAPPKNGDESDIGVPSAADSASQPMYLSGFDTDSLPEPRKLDRFFDQPRK